MAEGIVISNQPPPLLHPLRPLTKSPSHALKLPLVPHPLPLVTACLDDGYDGSEVLLDRELALPGSFEKPPEETLFPEFSHFLLSRSHYVQSEQGFGLEGLVMVAP